MSVRGSDRDPPCYAELRRACEDAAKDVILADLETIETSHLVAALGNHERSS